MKLHKAGQISYSDFSEISEIQDNESEAELLRNVQLVIDGLNEYTTPDRRGF